MTLMKLRGCFVVITAALHSPKMVNDGIKKPIKYDGYDVLFLEEKEDDESFL